MSNTPFIAPVYAGVISHSIVRFIKGITCYN